MDDNMYKILLGGIGAGIATIGAIYKGVLRPNLNRDFMPRDELEKKIDELKKDNDDKHSKVDNTMEKVLEKLSIMSEHLAVIQNSVDTLAEQRHNEK